MPPLALIATLALALTASAQDFSILPYPPQPTCTKTITHPPGCCPKIAAHTATSYTDCGNCALSVETKGPMCMMYCGTSTATDPSKTTTVTKCAASTTPDIQTSYMEVVSAPPKVEPGCTSTATEFAPPCGDCGVSSIDVTKTVDCGACVAIETVTTKKSGFAGICACPTAPGTRTVGVCKVTEEPVLKAY